MGPETYSKATKGGVIRNSRKVFNTDIHMHVYETFHKGIQSRRSTFTYNKYVKSLLGKSPISKFGSGK